MTTMQIPQLDATLSAPSAASAPSAVSRFDGSTGPRIIGPKDGKFVDFKSVGVRFMVWGAETGGTFSLVEHPIPPRPLAAPPHIHTRAGEHSHGPAGRLGAVPG